MSIRCSSFTLRSSSDVPLHLDLRWPADKEPRAAIMVCHGFKGFKDWGFFPYASECLARRGFAVTSLDFSHNGVGERPGEFDRLDLFEANNYSLELDDLAMALDWSLSESPVASSVAGKTLGLLGHSRAAVPVLVTALERQDIGAVVTWSGVGEALRYSDRQLEQWEQDGRMEFVNSRTGQRMAVGFGFVEDVRRNAQRFDLSRAADLKPPHLIVHGTEDMAVPMEEADMLRAGRAEPGCRLLRVEGAGHTFNAVHPFEGSTPELEQALAATGNWFDSQLTS